MSFKKNIARFILISLAFIVCGVVIYYTISIFLPLIFNNKIEYNVNQDLLKDEEIILKNTIKDSEEKITTNNEIPISNILVTHIKTP